MLFLHRVTAKVGWLRETRSKLSDVVTCLVVFRRHSQWLAENPKIRHGNFRRYQWVYNPMHGRNQLIFSGGGGMIAACTEQLSVVFLI